jgi:ABC-type bacteriocin/lantibiotic exporter with double-glycine peptidase domain
MLAAAAAALALVVADAGAAPVSGTAALRLPVPVVRQAKERCGPAALEMVLRYYGATPAAVAEAGTAYDSFIHGTLITDLAAAARRAGYAAAVVTLTPDSLVALLARGVPPIVLFQSGTGPITRGHYGVVVGFDPARGRFAMNDGGRSTHEVSSMTLEKRWRGSDHHALVVSPLAAAATP